MRYWHGHIQIKAMNGRAIYVLGPEEQGIYVGTLVYCEGPTAGVTP